jgi:hypothetical protein
MYTAMVAHLAHLDVNGAVISPTSRTDSDLRDSPPYGIKINYTIPHNGSGNSIRQEFIPARIPKSGHVWLLVFVQMTPCLPRYH